MYMPMRRLASLGLCVALIGAQPGCAHQLSSRDRDIVVLAALAGLCVGALVLEGLTDHCKGPATCGRSPDERAPMPPAARR
jgi:hypothetical protein